MKRLNGKTALITGASRGIGRAVALAYAKEGAEVICVARTVGALEELDDEIRSIGGTAVLVPLDMAEHDKIDQLGASLYERFGKLDILVGNAAILGEMTPLTHANPQQWDKVMNINATANWRLLRSMHPLLNAADAARVIMVTSGVTEGAFPFWGAYAASKTALEMIVNIYAAEQEKTNIRTNLIDPGVMATSMRQQAFPGEDQTTLMKPEDITEAFIQLALESCPHNGARINAVELASAAA